MMKEPGSDSNLWLNFKREPAQVLLDHFRVIAPAVDVLSLAERLGVQVLESAHPPWDGAATSDERAGARIYINKSSPLSRRRFTLAHELGHIILHPTGEEHRDPTLSPELNSREIEANQFAIDLLVPRAMLQAYARILPVEHLPRVFGVSRAVMEHRLRTLLASQP